MSARILPLPREMAWLLPKDIKASLVCWGAYLAVLICYCTLYQVIVSRVPPDVASSISIIHVSKNWGVWLLTTPIIFSLFRKHATTPGERALRMMAFAVAVLLVSVTVPVAIDLLTHERDAASSLMIFLPRYVATMGVVYLIWHVFVRERPASGTAEFSMSPPVSAPVTTLLVSKGADQCLIQVGRIECASAAGNYVEIVERGQCYLMRTTLKQVQELLPATDFIRIHRSHIVKRDEIERIKAQPSGNGTVQLRNGRVLPMSKKHKHELRRYRAPD